MARYPICGSVLLLGEAACAACAQKLLDRALACIAGIFMIGLLSSASMAGDAPIGLSIVWGMEGFVVSEAGESMFDRLEHR